MQGLEGSWNMASIAFFFYYFSYFKQTIWNKSVKPTNCKWVREKEERQLNVVMNTFNHTQLTQQWEEKNTIYFLNVIWLSVGREE